MHVSRESAAETHERLARVIAAAEFRVLDGVFALTEHPVSSFPAERASDALAFVRDEATYGRCDPPANRVMK